MSETCPNNRWRVGTLVALLVVLISGHYAVKANESKNDRYSTLDYEDKRNEYVLMKNLVPVLNKAGLGARIYYATDCPADIKSAYYPYPFPATNVHPSSENLSGFDAVRELFRADPNVEVSENLSGVIDIVIGKPSTALLKTHITEIKLEAEEHWNPPFTINAVRSNAEVQTSAMKLGIHLDQLQGLSVMAGHHKQGDPFLAGPLKNLTLDQALGLVAQELKVVVLYGACVKQNYVSIDYTGGPGFAVSALLP